LPAQQKEGGYMVPISIDDYIKKLAATNKDIDEKSLKESLIAAEKAKRNGTVCTVCGSPIWAAGTATVGWNGCFTCITGETDGSEDYEIEEKLSKKQ
jgi:RNA polymerase-binding transcription factor DksA